jgi:hypothetical protein
MMRVIAYLWIVLLLGACEVKYHDSISGNGKVKEIQISNDTIEHIIISDKLEVVIIPSDTNRLAIRADENLLDVIRTDVTDGTLVISTNKMIRMARSKEVLVYGKAVKEVEASFRAMVMNEDTLRADEFKIKLNSGADASITGNFKSLSATITSGSHINLAGKTEDLSIDANTAADVDAYDLVADETNIMASTAADVRITVKNKAIFNANSLSDIRYRGEPSIIDSKTTSLADITRVKF